jgi:hypothetical protein
MWLGHSGPGAPIGMPETLFAAGNLRILAIPCLRAPGSKARRRKNHLLHNWAIA